MMMKGNVMTHSELDLSKNLTEKRIPAELRGAEAYRVVVFEVDPDTNGVMVENVYELATEFLIYSFNKKRARWAREGFRVYLEPIVYA
jgi:hypothetical protein